MAVHTPCVCTGDGRCGFGVVKCECGVSVVKCEGECGVCVVCACTGDGACGTQVCECGGDGECGHTVIADYVPANPAAKSNPCLILSGVCSTCSTTPKPEHQLKCCICQNMFHANKTCTKQFCTDTFVVNFTAKSTKNNFSFSCDFCLTEREALMSDKYIASVIALQGRLNQLQSLFTDEFNSIRASLTANQSMPASAEKKLPRSQDRVKTYSQSSPAPQVATIKISAPARSTESVPPEKEENLGLSFAQVTAIAIDQSISIDGSRQVANGSLYVDVVGKDSIDKFKQEAKKQAPNSKVEEVSSKCPTVMCVGMASVPEIDTIMPHLGSVNETLKPLLNDRSFKVLKIMPCKGGQYHKFVARVSNDVRRALEDLGDKVRFGSNRLNVYDHLYVPRCTKCQGFNHFAKSCKPDSIEICSHCASPGHGHTNCPNKANDPKCHSCAVLGNVGTAHTAANLSECSAFKKEKEKLKKSIQYYRNKNF